jgi:hypothetical protein
MIQQLYMNGAGSPRERHHLTNAPLYCCNGTVFQDWPPCMNISIFVAMNTCTLRPRSLPSFKSPSARSGSASLVEHLGTLPTPSLTGQSRLASAAFLEEDNDI